MYQWKIRSIARFLFCFSVLLLFQTRLALGGAITWSDKLDAIFIEPHTHKAISGELWIQFRDFHYERGTGLADDHEGKSINEDTPFLIASVSKHMVASAILKLQEKGQLRVSDPVSKYFPDYPRSHLIGRNGIEVTLNHLLQHTSGIPNALGFSPVREKVFVAPISWGDVFSAIHEQSLRFDPGTRFEYSNTGYIILGELIHRVSGMTYTDFMQTRFFNTQGLNRMSVGFPSIGIFFARSYVLHEDGSRVDFMTEHSFKDWAVTDVFASGNIFSSAGNLGQWIRNLMGGRILSRYSIEQMVQPSSVQNYGYGLAIDHDSWGRLRYSHSGEWLGFQSKIYFYPYDDLTVVWLSNQSMPGEDLQALMDQVHDVFFTP